MSEQFILQDPGEGIHEAEIREIHVAEGDEVSDGDIILTVETDKAAVDIPAPFSGVIEEIRFDVGDVAEVGDVLMTYGGDKAKSTKDEDEEKNEDEEKSDEAKSSNDLKRRREVAESIAQKEKDETDDKEIKPAKSKADAERTSGPKASTSSKSQPVPAAPATRRMARELGVDLQSVDPSGPSGRVTSDDVRAAAESEEGTETGKETKEQSKKKRNTARSSEDPALPDFSQWGATERVPLRSIRRTTARRMTQSWSRIPHVTHQDQADITALDHWRREHKASVERQGGKLTLTVLVMKALAATLKEFPRFNASLDTDDETIVLKRYYHIGVAVDTEQGLMVPVVRDVDSKSIVALSGELVRTAEKARAGKLSREDMQGGTFTVTNPGPIGGRVMTPIINHPQVAILGLGQARLEPLIDGDLNSYEIVPRLMLPVCLAFDHRVNDGADAGRFTKRLIEIVSDTETMLLNT